MVKKRKTNVISRLFYRLVLLLVKLFYPKFQIEGLENLPQEACIIVGNHTQMNGPICSELYFPGPCQTWCTWEMMDLKQVPAYAYQDFWSKKPRAVRWFYKLLSYLIAPLAACIFNNAHTIPVYHDMRISSTFKQTISSLQAEEKIVIFPEHNVPYNHIVNEFQNRFIDVAAQYYRRTGKAIHFVPVYLAPKLKTIYFGKPIQFCPDPPIAQERVRICRYLMDEITQIAVHLPEHTVIPYANIPKKEYKTNLPER